MSTLTPTTLTALELSATLPARGRVESSEIDARSPASRSLAKRTLDMVGAGLGLIVLAPLMTAIAAAVRFDSAGPALFRQKRLGRDGQIFEVLKFRTMTTDAEQRLDELEGQNESAGGVLFKIRHDPRVTRLGKFLRKTSLDELPQLLNVLKGEMSLVGPRPLQLRDCQKLEALDSCGFERRLSVTPGLTGPWQVGGRSDVDSDTMLQLDLNYVENWSLATDLRILCQTVVVVLAGRGAC